MITRIKTILFLLFISVGVLNAQTPLLKGKVDISITKGTMQCDFTLSNFPHIKNYYIYLNTGLNIRNFWNKKIGPIGYERNYNDTLPAVPAGDAFGYYFPDNTGKAKFLPDHFTVNYVGAFPVISDTLNPSRGDWKGNIACNGKTIRATEQSAWYPILYDIDKDIVYSKVAYDIDVTCSDCRSIYVNGSNPVTGTTAHLKSDSAVEPMLFAGNYDIDSSNSTYFLNTNMSKEQLKEFGEMTDSYKKFYEKNLAIPYTYNITYIRTTPVSKHSGFLFVTYPTITTVGWDDGFKEIFGEKGKWFKPFIAHELGHYYFGTCVNFNSSIREVLEEGFTEYLSFKITQSLIADSVYQKRMKENITELKDFKAVSIGNVKSVSDGCDNNKYKYVYFPVILTAIEKEIGKEKMWRWLHLVLTTKVEFTNYDFLKSTLSMALKDDAKVDLIEKKYFKSDASVQNAISTIEQK